MNAQILDGKACSKLVRDEILEKVQMHPCAPQLGVILVGDNPRSTVYVRNKAKAAEAVGIHCNLTNCAEQISTDGLVRLIMDNNENQYINGFIVQLPLPKHIELEVVARTIDPRKDVDCFHPNNQGLLLRGTPPILPTIISSNILIL